MNAILGYRRSIVHDQPGATRDVVTAQTALDGWPVEWADTAGLCSSEDPVESAGVSRTIGQMAVADLVAYVRDVREPWLREDEHWLQAALLVVHNKCDLLADSSDDGSKP